MPKAPVCHILYKTAQVLGPKRVEILKLFFEQNLQPDQIRMALGLSEPDYLALVQHPSFVKEYEKQNKFFLRSSKQLRAREKKSKDKKRNSGLTMNERLQNLAPDALGILENQMRNSPSEAIRQKAALELLDRAGYVKVEKRLTYDASAEEVIKELNRQRENIIEATEVKELPSPQ